MAILEQFERESWVLIGMHGEHMAGMEGMKNGIVNAKRARRSIYYSTGVRLLSTCVLPGIERSGTLDLEPSQQGRVELTVGEDEDISEELRCQV